MCNSLLCLVTECTTDVINGKISFKWTFFLNRVAFRT